MRALRKGHAAIFNLTQGIRGEAASLNALSALVTVRSRRPSQSSVKASNLNLLDRLGKGNVLDILGQGLILQQSRQEPYSVSVAVWITWRIGRLRLLLGSRTRGAKTVPWSVQRHFADRWIRPLRRSDREPRMPVASPTPGASMSMRSRSIPKTKTRHTSSRGWMRCSTDRLQRIHKQLARRRSYYEAPQRQSEQSIEIGTAAGHSLKKTIQSP